MLVPVPNGTAQTLPWYSQFDITKAAAIIFFTLQCSELLHLFSLLEIIKGEKKRQRRISPSQLLFGGASKALHVNQTMANIIIFLHYNLLFFFYGCFFFYTVPTAVLALKHCS